MWERWKDDDVKASREEEDLKKKVEKINRRKNKRNSLEIDIDEKTPRSKFKSIMKKFENENYTGNNNEEEKPEKNYDIIIDKFASLGESWIGK